MPKENLTVNGKRLFRAAQKAGFGNRRMSLSIHKDGKLTIEVAAPSRAEVNLDLSRDLDDIVENERAKWGDTDGKDTP